MVTAAVLVGSSGGRRRALTSPVLNVQSGSVGGPPGDVMTRVASTAPTVLSWELIPWGPDFLGLNHWQRAPWDLPGPS